MLPINDLKRHFEAMGAAVPEALARVAASGWYVMGRELAAFEAAFAEYCGLPEAIGVANGTDGLELALRALDVGAGDGVITVANAGGYASTAIGSVGAYPIYVDIDPDTLLMSSESLARALQRDARAIIVTHLFGRVADTRTIARVIANRPLAIIEDCAQAHGAVANDRMAGSWGHAGCFSFYPTKNLGALGDGGMVVTGDHGVAERLRELRQYGWSSKYVKHSNGGRNSRLDEIQAAVLAAMLPSLEGWNVRRREIATQFSRTIRHPAIQVAPEGGREYVAHLYVVQSPRRDSLRAHLAREGVATDIHYPIPDHRQSTVGVSSGESDLAQTEIAASRVLTLPCFPEMTDEEVERVVSACNRWEA